MSLLRRWRQRGKLATFGVRSSMPGLSVTLNVHRGGRVTWSAFGGWDTGGPWHDHRTTITVDNDGVEWVNPVNAVGRVRRFGPDGRQQVTWDDRARGWRVPEPDPKPEQLWREGPHPSGHLVVTIPPAEPAPETPTPSPAPESSTDTGGSTP